MFPKWPSGRSKLEPNRLLKLTKIVPFCVKFDNKLKIAAYSSRSPAGAHFFGVFWRPLEPPRGDYGAPKPPQDATWRLPDTAKTLQHAQRRTETTLRRPKTRQRRFQDVSKKRSCSIFNAKMKPNWHQNGIKNRCSLGRAIFRKSCSRFNRGSIFQDLGV